MANKEPYWVQTYKNGLIKYSDDSLRDEDWRVVAMPLRKEIDKNPNKEKAVIRKKLQPIEKKSSKAKEAARTLGKAAARAWSVMASFVWWWAWAAAARGAKAARKALKK